MSRSIGAVLPVRVVDAAKRYGETGLWSNIDLVVESGEFVSLAGPSGSGKTTLLNCIGLLESLDAGSVQYGDHDVTRSRPRERRRLYRDAIGFLFQDSGLVDTWSVHDNVAIALGYRRMRSGEQTAIIDKALDEMGLGGYRGARAHTLSGGERQRVGLARLLLKKASVVLADEPTASLDATNSARVLQALRRLADRGAAVIVSTHDDLVLEASDRVFRLGRPAPSSRFPALRIQGCSSGLKPPVSRSDRAM